MESVHGLDIAKKPCSGSSSLRMESRLGVCNWAEFSGMASEERRGFGVRAAERSVDAGLAVGEESLTSAPDLNGRGWISYRAVDREELHPSGY